MSLATMRIILSIILIIHGLGHGLMIFAALNKPLSTTHSLKSWIFEPIMGTTLTTMIGISIALISLVGFTVAGLNLTGWFFTDANWQLLIQIASLVSLFGILIFWNGFPFFFPNKLSVIIVDIYMLISLIWLRWPSEL